MAFLNFAKAIAADIVEAASRSSRFTRERELKWATGLRKA
jgi:hypothetical protein